MSELLGWGGGILNFRVDRHINLNELHCVFRLSIGYCYSVGDMLLQHVPRLFAAISRSFEFSVSSFVQYFFQCLCFYNECGSSSLCIRFIQ